MMGHDRRVWRRYIMGLFRAFFLPRLEELEATEKMIVWRRLLAVVCLTAAVLVSVLTLAAALSV